jgi:hypothetical protein
MAKDRTKTEPTPKRDAVRRAKKLQRRADLVGTSPWKFKTS